MKIPTAHPRLWPAVLTGLFVGLGMGVFVATSSLDTAFEGAPAIIGAMAAVGSFLLVFFLH